jgi:membrane protein implicated in regulation of membrane protease activity
VLTEIAKRIIFELGPWLWMAFGFAMMAVEMFSGRGIPLSLGLGAMIAGTIAVFGASGVWPATSSAIQSVIFFAFASAIFIVLKLKSKRA